MSSTTTHLNLARKWRSQQFDQIIGQELSVRMLKNSLYLHHFFPVYLFSGQRGCGKTTTARVFASAINCEQFEAFQKEPRKYITPCLTCSSCKAMLAGKHPDFIEMDAASHTGVDNVRQIIDASSLMPLMGRKKIYLIDEAHMLSKAAFNAFLKILEEPPASVLFILATTDPDKIIDTVRSRCFQLFFKPIDAPVLLDHLMRVCNEEQIAFEKEGLDLIIKETEGSARDALNMLESVRFSAGTVSKQAVLRILGHVEDECIIKLFACVMRKDSAQLLKTLQAIDQSQSAATYIWRTFLQLLRSCIWIKHGVEPDTFNQHVDVLKKMIEKIHWRTLHRYVDMCYRNEQVFLKTTHQHAFLEIILLQLCSGPKVDNDNSNSGCSSTPSPSLSAPLEGEDDELIEDEEEEEEIIDEAKADEGQKWTLCVRDIATLDDPLIVSIFKQSSFKCYDTKSGALEVEFCKKFVFFQDWLDNTKTMWQPILQKRFGSHVSFAPQFTGKDMEPAKTAPIVLDKAPERPVHNKKQGYQKGQYQKRSFNKNNTSISHGRLVNISNQDEWPLTHRLLQVFPGTVHAHEVNQ